MGVARAARSCGGAAAAGQLGPWRAPVEWPRPGTLGKGCSVRHAPPTTCFSSNSCTCGRGVGRAGSLTPAVTRGTGARLAGRAAVYGGARRAEAEGCGAHLEPLARQQQRGDKRVVAATWRRAHGGCHMRWARSARCSGQRKWRGSDALARARGCAGEPHTHLQWPHQCWPAPWRRSRTGQKALARRPIAAIWQGATSWLYRCM